MAIIGGSRNVFTYKIESGYNGKINRYFLFFSFVTLTRKNDFSKKREPTNKGKNSKRFYPKGKAELGKDGFRHGFIKGTRRFPPARKCGIR